MGFFDSEMVIWIFILLLFLLLHIIMSPSFCLSHLYECHSAILEYCL